MLRATFVSCTCVRHPSCGGRCAARTFVLVLVWHGGRPPFRGRRRPSVPAFCTACGRLRPTGASSAPDGF
eukprot:5729749-Pyramimonas_sp.AAC.1